MQEHGCDIVEDIKTNRGKESKIYIYGEII